MEPTTAGARATRARAGGRRAEYAEVTRQAIVDAARKLFGEQGYFATRVDDIAVEARVSPATVYGVTKGKQGLLHTLIEAWSTDPLLHTAYAGVESATDADTVLRCTAAGTRAMREEWGDVMRVALGAAAHDTAAAESLALATERYRAGLAIPARRLDDLGRLRAGSSVTHATDVLWFYFGYTSYRTLVGENGWSYDQAERWLYEQARGALVV